MPDHAGRPREWARWPTIEGGYLVDRRAVDEALAAHAIDAGEGREEVRLRRGLAALFDCDVDRCPHGLPLGVDLARPDPALGLDLLCGPAMGSGCSPWTRALLIALDRYLAPGTVVADVGTGSGVLGLAALRRGAARVDAVDRDALAVAIARRNARANGLADRFDARCGSAERLGDGYDLAVVSLGTVPEIASVMDGAARRVGPGGVLAASPAEGEQEAARLADLVRRAGFSPLERIEVEGWFVEVARAPS